MTDENELIQTQEEAIAMEIANEANIDSEEYDVDADIDIDEEAATVYGQQSDVDWWGAKTASEYDDDVEEDGGALRSPDLSRDDCDCCEEDLAELNLE